ncbi:MAG: DUF4091 domain-containing protein [Planctomycetes bacterium]|nr:DUF4091 domain-containing protein [Planctomycetota bacterium]
MDVTDSPPANRVGAMLLATALFWTFTADAGPAVHWTFDLTDDEVRDAEGDCHGKLEGDRAADLVRPGVFGSAVFFDMGKRRVRFPHGAGVSLHDDFTIEYVIKPFRVDGFRTIFWKGNRKVTPEAINYYLDLRDGRPELKTKDASGRWIVYSTPTVLGANEWHHVVFTFQGGKVEIFVNGQSRAVNVSENGARSTSLLDNAFEAVVGDGANPSGPAYSFHGLIDDLRIHQGRELGMLGADYQARWQELRRDCREREDAFERERKQRAAEARREIQREYETLFSAKASAPDAPFVATVLPSTERLDGSPDFFRKIRRFSRTVTCSAARREYEGFQVIVMGRRGAEPVAVSVSVSDLVHEDGTTRIPASEVAWGRVERVTTEEPDLPVAFVGAIPDVIIEDGAPVTAPPGDFGGLFCRIHTGEATAGRYEGRLTLKAGEFTETIRIVLTVRDFALPRRGSLRTAFCFFEDYYRRWHDLETLSDARREAIYEFLLRYRLSPCNIYSGAAPHPDLKFLEKYRERINFFTVGRMGEGTDTEIRERVAARADLFRKVREAGLEDSMVFYGFDELAMHMNHLPAAVKISGALRAAWPELKMMQTSFPIPELQPLYNVWAPLFHEFAEPERLAVLQSMRARGDRIWWYAADAPRHPCPNFFLDYPVFDCRVIGTLSYLHRVEGILYWCVNREWQTNMDVRKQWPDAAWKSHIFHAHTGKRKYKNGMGNLVYPGRDGALCASLRLENLRDGLEDHEYLCALDDAVQRLEASETALASSLLPDARALQAPPPNVATAVNAWSRDPAHLLEYRERVGRMVEKAARAIGRHGGAEDPAAVDRNRKATQ